MLVDISNPGNVGDKLHLKVYDWNQGRKTIGP